MAILSKQETAVMQAVYELARNRQSALFGLEDVMARVKPVRRLHKKDKKTHSETEAPLGTDVECAAETPAPAESVAVADEPPRKHFRFGKRRTEDDCEDEDTPTKIYVDEPPEIKGLFEYVKPVRYEEIPHILEVLDMEEYIELTEAKADGEVKYVAELLSRGRRWERDEADRKRSALIKLGMTVATPILSFILGILLRVLF